MDQFQRLSNEVMLSIFSFFNYDELIILRNVCNWFEILVDYLIEGTLISFDPHDNLSFYYLHRTNEFIFNNKLVSSSIFNFRENTIVHSKIKQVGSFLTYMYINFLFYKSCASLAFEDLT